MYKMKGKPIWRLSFQIFRFEHELRLGADMIFSYHRFIIIDTDINSLDPVEEWQDKNGRVSTGRHFYIGVSLLFADFSLKLEEKIKVIKI